MTVVFLLLSFFAKSPFILIIYFNIIIILYLSEKRISIKLISILYLFLMTVLVSKKLLEFDFIPQARVILNSNPNVLYWFFVGHPHAIRLLIAYPGYIISEFYNIELNTGFSYYGISMFVIMYMLIANTLLKLSVIKNFFLMKMILAVIPLLILPLLMNGRLIAAYLGFTILINLFVRLFNNEDLGKIKIFVIGSIGLILTMVSSGTMVVSALYIIFLSYVFNQKHIKSKRFIKKALIFLLVLSPIFYKLLSYYWLMFMRNVNYYGGGINGTIDMLNHGIGRYLPKNNGAIVFIIILAFVIIFLNIVYLNKLIKKRNRKITIIAGINISLYGMLFGYSTGLMMIPPLIILMLLFLERQEIC